MKEDDIKRDDLTKISGIGPARQRWLAKLFNVYTYEDLASLAVDDIVAQFKAEGKPYSKSEIELWPLEAAKLAAEKSKLAFIDRAEPSTSELGYSTIKKTELGEPLANRANNGQWKPVATFIVEFQTRRTNDQTVEKRIKVNYHDTDQEKLFDIVESEQIFPWMIEQAGHKLVREIQEIPKAETEIKRAVESPLKIIDLHLYQPADVEIELTSERSGRPYAGVVKAGQPFVAKANLRIGKEAKALFGKREILYRVQFLSQNRFTGKKEHLGEAKPGLLLSDETDYSALMRGLMLPQGAYRLRIVAVPESEDVLPSYFELPMLRVI